MSQTIYDTTPMRQVFKEGTWDVKLSFLVMGFANLVNKQFTKGLLFLLSEIAFLVAFVIKSSLHLKGMITLGTPGKNKVKPLKRLMGLFTVQVAGDNSMLLLIFGLASLIFCSFAIFTGVTLRVLVISWPLNSLDVKFLTLSKTSRPWLMVVSTWDL